jgi:hypothetical protein
MWYLSFINLCTIYLGSPCHCQIYWYHLSFVLCVVLFSKSLGLFFNLVFSFNVLLSRRRVLWTLLEPHFRLSAPLLRRWLQLMTGG